MKEKTNSSKLFPRKPALNFLSTRIQGDVSLEESESNVVLLKVPEEFLIRNLNIVKENNLEGFDLMVDNLELFLQQLFKELGIEDTLWNNEEFGGPYDELSHEKNSNIDALNLACPYLKDTHQLEIDEKILRAIENILKKQEKASKLKKYYDEPTVDTLEKTDIYFARELEISREKRATRYKNSRESFAETSTNFVSNESYNSR